jgi:hypothetical protein
MTDRLRLRKLAAFGAAAAMFLPAAVRSLYRLGRGEGLGEEMLRDLVGAGLLAVIASLLVFVAVKLWRGGVVASGAKKKEERQGDAPPARLLLAACVLTVLAVAALSASPAPSTVAPLVVAAGVSQLLLLSYAVQGTCFAPAGKRGAGPKQES